MVLIANIKQQSAIGSVSKKIQQCTIGGELKRYNNVHKQIDSRWMVEILNTAKPIQIQQSQIT